jgi:hypothetical protein
VASLQSKMINNKRGGYCFEQNMLFRAGLRSLGYRITSLQGRVVRGLEIDAQRPAIHMLLQVELPDSPCAVFRRIVSDLSRCLAAVIASLSPRLCWLIFAKPDIPLPRSRTRMPRTPECRRSNGRSK